MNKVKKVILEHVKCPLGCPADDEIVLTGRDLLHNLPGDFIVVKCRICELMRTSPRPTADTIGLYYPDDYGPYLGTKVSKLKRKKITGLKKLLKAIVTRLIKFNTIPLPPIKPGRLLELGCASGSYMHHMADRGWQVQGIEFSEKAASAAAQLGYHVHAGPLETAPQPDAPFDLIVGWMVLEHLHDPVGGLKKLREWASPGAWLVLSVPNAKSLEFRIFKENWFALQLPTHLHHFTPATLEKVLLAGGWKLDKVYHQRVLNNLIASIGYFLRKNINIKLGQALINYAQNTGRSTSIILYPFAWLLSIFGQTGRMTIWAKII